MLVLDYTVGPLSCSAVSFNTLTEAGCTRRQCFMVSHGLLDTIQHLRRNRDSRPNTMLYVYCVLLVCNVDNDMMLALTTWLGMDMPQQQSLDDIHGSIAQHHAPEILKPIKPS